MIQITSRRSRGARLRRPKPLSLYGLALLAAAVVLASFFLLKH